MNLSPLEEVKKFWCNFLWCQINDLEWNKSIIVERNKIESTDSEIHIWKWMEWWTIISCPKWIYKKISWLNLNDLEKIEINNLISEKVQKKMEVFWPVISSYILVDPKKLYVSNFVRKLSFNDVEFYNKFIEDCSPDDLKMVCFDFESKNQVFFWFFEWGRLVSVWNYENEIGIDLIAHIWIVTLKSEQGKWFARLVVGSVITDIFSKWLIPQWRAYEYNLVSLKMAKEFGFINLYSSYSLCPTRIRN